jgi:hypothetical protein
LKPNENEMTMLIKTALTHLLNLHWSDVSVGSIPWILLFALSVALAMASVACMMPGPAVSGGAMNHGRGIAPFLGTATLKTPPAWGPELAQQYPFATWINDVITWSMATDMEMGRQGPAVAMQLTGAARWVARSLMEEPGGAQRLQMGVDLNDGNHVTGLMFLVQSLSLRFAPLETELSTRAMYDMMSFRRNPNETIDMLLTRFDMVRNRALSRGGMTMSHQGLAWLLMKSIGLSADQWDRALDSLQIPID